MLDVACGSGRHVRWFAQRGCRVTGVDRDAAAIESLREFGEMVVADIEHGPWPFAGRRFDAVIVTNYLWRPLLPAIVDSVGTVLIYETFAQGNERRQVFVDARGTGLQQGSGCSRSCPIKVGNERRSFQREAEHRFDRALYRGVR